MSGGQLALAFISGGLGFAIADFADRWFATYDPSATGTPPTDRFTGGTNGTLANTLNVASPPGAVRIGVGIGITALFGLGAYAARKNALATAALQGATIGAGIKLFSVLWNSYVIGNLLKPADTSQATMQKSMGARLYPAEIVAAQNLTQSPVPYTAPQGLNRAPQMAALNGPPMGRDVGPFAVGQPAPQPAPPPANQNAPVPQPMPAPAPMPMPQPDDGCGCLGDRLPNYLGFLGETGT